MEQRLIDINDSNQKENNFQNGSEIEDSHPFEFLYKVDLVTTAAPSSTSTSAVTTSSVTTSSSSSSSMTPAKATLANYVASSSSSSQILSNSALHSHFSSSSISTTSSERDKKEFTLQLKIKEEKLKSFQNQIEYLQELNKKLSTTNESQEKELIKLKKEISLLMIDKDNLSNEVRKLSRSQTLFDSSSTSPTISSSSLSSTPSSSSSTATYSSTSSASSNSSTSTSLWGQMTVASRELCRAEEQINSLNHEIINLKTTQCTLQRQVEKFQERELLTTQDRKELEEEKEKRFVIESQLLLIQQDNHELATRIEEQERVYFSAQSQYQEEILSLRNEIEKLQSKLIEKEETRAAHSSLPVPVPASLPSVAPLSSSSPSLLAEMESYQATIEQLKDKLFESEKSRRKLHNKLQDLKGNIRVYVRCRPFLSSDQEENSGVSCVNCNADGTTITLTEHCQRGVGQVYQFDQVYNSGKTQYDIFKDVSDFVQSALDGYRVCVFSYGQTGSGKTHTMTGEGKEHERGLIPRSVEHIINQINEMKSTGWSVEATYSMLEVYNESLIDLLSQENNSESNNNKLKIIFQNDRVMIPQLTTIPMISDCVDDALDQLQEILHRANTARTTASTAMNERSSRSHVLFLMNIQSTHQDGTILQGGLRLVDLAGSERLDRCGTSSDAQRFRETVNINKSLSCLGDVFMALGQKSSHVPFRNSKLTMLLQDCLSGEGKTLMFVNISPTTASGHETYCSLKFASQVNQVQLGTAKKNITITTIKPISSSSAPPAPSAPPVLTSSITNSSQHSSPPPPPANRARPPLTHQNSFMISSSSSLASSPATTTTTMTTLVPSQIIPSSNGNKSHLAYAPAARVTSTTSTAAAAAATATAHGTAGNGTIPATVSLGSLSSTGSSTIPGEASSTTTTTATTSALKQAPISLQSMRAKRQGVFPSAAPPSTSAIPTAAATTTSSANSLITQASKRIKSAKSGGGTWR